ncbi:MAG: FtsW/RodA/SpoVE family cell cycle protein [Burkholderiaceae bacterium]
MPSRGRRGLPRLLALAMATLAGLVSGLGFWLSLPDPREGRELALALAAQSAARATMPDRSPTAPADVFAAQALCLAIAGADLGQVDCRLGQPLGLQEGMVAAGVKAAQASALARAQQQLGVKIAEYAAIRDALVPVLQGSDRSWLVGGIELRLARLKGLQGQTAVAYPDLFDALLVAEGVRYDSFTGRFFAQRWDVARLLDGPEQVRARAERLLFVLQWLPLFFGLAVFALVYASLRVLGGMAALVALVFAVIAGLGLVIVADASLRFGQGSGVYLLNPFSYALERQTWVVIGGLLLPVLALVLTPVLRPRLAGLVTASRRWLAGLVVLPMAGTAAVYGVLGPAAGSEALKLTACLFAGLVTTWYARPTFLARKVIPNIFSPRSFLQTLSEIVAGRSPPSAQRLVHTSLFRAYLGLLLLGLITVASAALVFSDFGGTLVSGLVFTALVFILFGLRLAVVFVAAGAIAGGIAWLTDKVQGRVQLMLDPMAASVSDFARLIKFSEAAQPAGYGLGTVRWCSFEGACLPIQVLSDYFPVLLSGALGLTGAVVVFLVLVGFYIGLMARAMVGFASGLGPVSLLFAVSFFLLLAALSQTVITYFGNWRLVPLTGLGLPLMSMGWSSMVSVAIGLSLLSVALALSHKAGEVQGR